MKYKVFESSEGNVFKYIFEPEDAVVEAVLYRYNDFYERTVICCSTMSGCPVGCKFCGTGKNFIRNLSDDEIVEQIDLILKDKNIEDVDKNGRRFQIMFMSMGEPLLNWDNVEFAIERLNEKYPNAELLLSTIAPWSDSYTRLIEISKRIPKVGLQFSIHKSTDAERSVLIPFEEKLSISQIRDFGLIWWKETGRKPYLNYCIDGTNSKKEDSDKLQDMFSPVVFCLTFSVVCSKDENMKEAGFKKIDQIRKFEQKFTSKGYDTRVFNPAGQDDIGGGCGQLWYVQKWMNNHLNKITTGGNHDD